MRISKQRTMRRISSEYSLGLASVVGMNASRYGKLRCRVSSKGFAVRGLVAYAPNILNL